MICGSDVARSVLSIPREVSIDGFSQKYGRSTDPLLRSAAAEQDGSSGLTTMLETAVASSLFASALRGSGWTPRTTEDDDQGEANLAVRAEDPSDGHIARVARRARELDVHGSRSTGAIHAEVLKSRMARLHRRVDASAKAGLLEDPATLPDLDERGRAGMEDRDDDVEDEEPVEPTATI